jgi:hypothetical protein
MTERNGKLLIGYVAAIAVCAAIALFDRVLIGLIGAGLSTAVFALAFLFPNSARDDQLDDPLARRIGRAWDDQDLVRRDQGLPNPENVALPIYYQIERQD